MIKRQWKSYPFKIKHLLLLIAFIVYVVLAIVIPPHFDFLCPWVAAVRITEGIPLYTQINLEEVIINGQAVKFPAHMPVYIYFLAFLILIFGNHMVVGKLFLVICAFIDALLLEKIYPIEIKDHEEQNVFLKNLSLFFLYNPVIVGLTFLGFFEPFAIMFLLLPIHLSKFFTHNDKRISYGTSLLAGLLLGIGFLTKWLPLIALPFLFWYGITKKKYGEMLSLGSVAVGLSGGLTLLLIQLYPDFLEAIFGFQITRGSFGINLFTYLFEMDSVSNAILVSIVLCLCFLIYTFDISQNEQVSYIMYIGIAFALFFCFYKIYFHHYIYWLTPFLLLLFGKLYTKKRLKASYLLVVTFIIQELLVSIWGNSETHHFLSPEFIQVFISFINHFCFLSYIFLFFKERKFITKTNNEILTKINPSSSEEEKQIDNLLPMD
ncbi:MAG: hypothetical protein GF308_21645 [Candidatus Heimdallarchaeota archaeon]|nr:hypothetical protein [Candidatus Heimdallarchaeota archaeon]